MRTADLHESLLIEAIATSIRSLHVLNKTLLHLHPGLDAMTDESPFPTDLLTDEAFLLFQIIDCLMTELHRHLKLHGIDCLFL